MGDWKRALIGLSCFAGVVGIAWLLTKWSPNLPKETETTKLDALRVDRFSNGAVTMNMDVVELKTGTRTDIYRTICVRPNGADIGVLLMEHVVSICGQTPVMTTIHLLQPNGTPMTCTFNEIKPDPKPTLERSSL